MHTHTRTHMHALRKKHLGRTHHTLWTVVIFLAKYGRG